MTEVLQFSVLRVGMPRCFRGFVVICVSVVAPLAEGATFSDEFNASKDYLVGDVSGSIWDGILNFTTLSVANSNTSNGGQLTFRSSLGYWENGLASGPFLFKQVYGDFTAELEINSVENVADHDVGILARVANVATAGAGEDWLCVRRYLALLNAARSVDNSSQTDLGNQFTAHNFLQLQRVGNNFYARSRASSAASWADLPGSPFSRADLNGVPLQVGIYQATFSATAATATFQRFSLTATTTSPTPPAASGGSSPSPSQITWTWQDNSSDETGFKLYVDAGTGDPSTLAATTLADIQSRTLSGYTANSAYAFQVAATNVAGDSAKTATITRSTLIQPVAAINFSDVTPTSITATPAGAFANLTVGSSGLRMANSTAGTASAWLQSLTPYVSSGLTPNTSYSFRASARNRDGVQSAALDVTQRTLAATPLPPTLSAATLNTVDIAITAGDTNPNGTQYALQHVPTGLYVQSSGALSASPIFRQTSAWATTTVTGLATGSEQVFLARARNTGDLIETADSATATLHTLAATPLAPVVSNPGGTTLDVSIAAGDGNPAGTEYALRETGSGLFVQANGTLGAAAVWQMAAAWGTTTVTGLATTTEFNFAARARNGALVETAEGPAGSGTTVDASAPDVINIAPATVGPTNSDSVAFSVEFDEDVTGFDAESDLVITHSGTAHTGVLVAGGPSIYTVTLTGLTGDGSLSLAVSTASDVEDLVGNPLGSSLTSAPVTLDNTPPGISIEAPSLGLTAGGPVSFDVVYTGAESILLSAGDVDLHATGTANAIVDVIGSGNAARTVTLSGITGDGTLAISIGDSTALDAAGNAANASAQSASVSVDNTGPVFSGLAVSPSAAHAGETVGITFDASEALLNDPEVKVNGGTAQLDAKAAYAYTYTVPQGAPVGSALIEITGFDALGNDSYFNSSAAFSILDDAPTVPLGGMPMLSLLAGVIAATGLLKRRR